MLTGPLVGIVTIAILGILSVLWHRHWGRGSLGMAFSTTLLGAAFLVAGTVGYRLDKHDRFVAGTPWSSTVLWGQIAEGVVVLLFSIYFWRRGLRTVHERPPDHFAAGSQSHHSVE